MFKFFARIPSTVRTTSGWSKPVPPSNFKPFPTTARALHQVKGFNDLLKTAPKIPFRETQLFQMKVTRTGPKAIQIRCFADTQAEKPKTDTKNANPTPTTQAAIGTDMLRTMDPAKALVMRYINSSLSLLVALSSLNYGSISLLLASTGGFAMSIWGTVPQQALLLGLLLGLLATVILYPAILVGELVDITLQVQNLALNEISLDSEVMAAVGTPISVVVGSQKETILGKSTKNAYAELVFEITGPKGKAIVRVLGHSLDQGMFRAPRWELPHVKVEDAKTGKVLYERRREMQQEAQVAHA